MLFKITRSVLEAKTKAPAFRGEGLPPDPLDFIYEDQFEFLAQAFEKVEKADLQKIDEIIALLGQTGVGILVQVLAKSENRTVRKAAVDSLIKMSDLARARVRAILDDSHQVWYVERNALLILSQIGREEEDQKRGRRFLKHPHARVREEALNAVLRLEGRKAEPLILAAIEDKDLKVQRRALACLSLLQPPSQTTAQKILAMLKSPSPKEKEEQTAFDQKLVAVIRTIANLPDLPLLAEVETALVEMARARTGGKGGFLKRLRKSLEWEEEQVVTPVIAETLGKIGGAKSLPFLEELAEQEGPLSRKAREAANSIKLRTAK